jgi:cytochrome c biogenesis protein CcmG, thiol:disulfide interchange protein DsbE
MRRFAVPAIAVALVAGLIAYEALSSGSGTAGQPSPPLPPKVMQAPKETLASLRGKPALINFWASWCDGCHEEAPELAKLQSSLGDAGALVGVDYTDNAGGARKFIRRYGFKFPILEDADGVYGARFHFTGLPATVVLDPQGRIVETLRGPQTTADLHEALREAAAR